MADGGTDTTGIPESRDNPELLGHGEAERAFLDAYNGGRLSHAWLITGPRGVGKATLAYRMARFLLSQGQGSGAGPGLFGADPAPESLEMAPGSPVFQRVTAGAHAGLMVIARSPDPKTKKMRGEIVIDDVRRLHGFFGLTAGDGEWRVAIVDAADELNRNAANALLKILEEPPAQGLLLLVAHAPGRLPATVRSRCRRLALRPLDGALVADIVGRHVPDLSPGDSELIAGLAAGSPGRALALAAAGGLDIYRDMGAITAALPRIGIPAVHAFAAKLARNDDAYRLFCDLFLQWLAGEIKSRATTGAETGELEAWTAYWDDANRLIERQRAVNLDRTQIVISLFTRLGETAARAAA